MERRSCGEAENMAATLSICIKEEQRATVHFLWAEGVKGAEITFMCSIWGQCITLMECIRVDRHV
jgi:hypothetical protein